MIDIGKIDVSYRKFSTPQQEFHENIPSMRVRKLVKHLYGERLMKGNRHSPSLLSWVSAVEPPIEISVGAGRGGGGVKMRLLEEKHIDLAFVHLIKDLASFRGNIEAINVVGAELQLGVRYHCVGHDGVTKKKGGGGGGKRKEGWSGGIGNGREKRKGRQQ